MPIFCFVLYVTCNLLLLTWQDGKLPPGFHSWVIHFHQLWLDGHKFGDHSEYLCSFPARSWITMRNAYSLMSLLKFFFIWQPLDYFLNGQASNLAHTVNVNSFKTLLPSFFTGNFFHNHLSDSVTGQHFCLWVKGMGLRSTRKTEHEKHGQQANSKKMNHGWSCHIWDKILNNRCVISQAVK